MLMGEHAVVYGYPCIVTAVNRRLTVTMEQASDGTVTIDAPQATNTRFVREAITQGITRWKIVHKGLRVTTKSELGNYGLGTSAAATVATLKALAVLFGKDVDNRHLFALAHNVVIAVQGAASGFDVAAAIWGGTLYFADGGKTIEPMESDSAPLVVAYTGMKADTTRMVAAVREKKKQYPERVERIFTGIAKLVGQAKEAWRDSDWERVGKLMDFNQEYLRDLGVSTEKIESFISAAKAGGALGAKLSGAGGGDCVIALRPEGAQGRLQIATAIQGAGGEIIDLVPHAEGVHI